MLPHPQSGRSRVFVGRTPDEMPEPPRCDFPGCPEYAAHRHHVVYDPEPVIKPLCKRHHEEITHLNGQQARKYRVTLSYKFRWRIWYEWRAGKLKPRRTQKALEWTSEWDKPEESSILYKPIAAMPAEPETETSKAKPRKVRKPKVRLQRSRKGKKQSKVKRKKRARNLRKSR
jgi:hypothetical protein